MTSEREKKGFLSLFFVLQSLCTVVSVEEDVTGRGGLLLFGELASWKRVGFSVRGEQPPGTERHRGREAHLSINIREKGQLEMGRHQDSRPSMMVWVVTIMIATITLTRGQQRSNDAVRFPGLSSSSMRVSSSQSSFTHSVCTEFLANS